LKIFKIVTTVESVKSVDSEVAEEVVLKSVNRGIRAIEAPKTWHCARGTSGKLDVSYSIRLKIRGSDGTNKASKMMFIMPDRMKSSIRLKFSRP